MNIKTMLITALATLRAESSIPNPNCDHEVILNVLKESRLPEYIDEADERSALGEIKDIIKLILDGSIQYDHSSVMKRIKVATTQNMTMYDAVVSFLEFTDVPEDPEKRVIYFNDMIHSNYMSMRQGLNGILLKQKLGKAIGALNGTEFRVDLTTALSDLTQTLSTYNERSHSKIPTLVTEVSTTDYKPFIKIFDSISQKAAGEGLCTGWKSINRMLGCNKGITEELWLMPALPYNAKSLFSLCMALSIAVFNHPDKPMCRSKEDLQPTILDLSLENELDVNLAYAYQFLYGHFEGAAPDLVKTSTEEMSKYTVEKINRNGWHYHFQRHTNSDFKVHYINDIISDLKQRGFRVVGIRADYFGTINRAGYGTGVAGSDIKEIYRTARNIQVVRNGGFILGPHQISPDGKRAKAADEVGFCKNLPGRGLYADCTSLDNEADGEFYFNKRVVEGRSYLEVQRGKHRVIKETAQEHHYTVIPFDDIGVLPWDTDKEFEVTHNSINKFTGGLGDDIF